MRAEERGARSRIEPLYAHGHPPQPAAARPCAARGCRTPGQLALARATPLRRGPGAVGALPRRLLAVAGIPARDAGGRSAAGDPDGAAAPAAARAGTAAQAPAEAEDREAAKRRAPGARAAAGRDRGARACVRRQRAADTRTAAGARAGARHPGPAADRHRGSAHTGARHGSAGQDAAAAGGSRLQGVLRHAGLLHRGCDVPLRALGQSLSHRKRGRSARPRVAHPARTGQDRKPRPHHRGRVAAGRIRARARQRPQARDRRGSTGNRA